MGDTREAGCRVSLISIPRNSPLEIGSTRLINSERSNRGGNRYLGHGHQSSESNSRRVMSRFNHTDPSERHLGRLRSLVSRRPEFVILSALVGFGAFLRLWALGSVQVPWFDEITAYYVPFVIVHGYGNTATWGLLHTSNPSTATQAYVLTYSAFTGMIVPALGTVSSAFWIRLPAVAFGTTLLVLLYALGSELFSKRVGLVAAALGTVVPWTFYWSRFAGITAPFELWSVASIYVALVAVRRKSSNLLLLSLLLGGLTVYTSEAGIAVLFLLILPFWLISSREFAPRERPGFRLRSIARTVRFYGPSICALALLLVPIVAFELQPTAVGSSVVGSGQLVWDHCGAVPCKISTFVNDAGLSWSPDFLGISGGVNGAQAAGFQTHISTGGAWQLGGGFTGMLTVLGFLLYPALVLLVFRWLQRGARADSQAGWLATLLIVSYTAVGGLVYFDNPNSPRLAFAAGFFVVFIAWFMVEAIEWVISLAHPALVGRRSQRRNPETRIAPTATTRAVAVTLGVALLIAPVGAVYVTDYFDEFPTISANYFYPQIEEVGERLSSEDLWSLPIVVLCPSNLTYILPTELAFYDPIQPPSASISVFNGSIDGSVGLLSSNPNGTVFVSMVNTNLSTLSQAGVPATIISQSAGVSLFWIPGTSRPHTTLEDVASWTRAPNQNDSASALQWNVSQPPPGGTIRTSMGLQGYTVQTQLPLNVSASRWNVTALFPEPLSLPSYNFISVSWNFVNSNPRDSAYIYPIYWNGLNYTVGAHLLVYPGTLLNVAPPSNQTYSFAGFRMGASLSPGASESMTLENVTVYGVTPVTSPSCPQPQAVLLGSQWDVAAPRGQGLWYNAFNSTLRVSLCVPQSSSGNSSPIYVALSVDFLSYLPTPLTLSIATSGQAGPSISGVDGIAGSSATVYAELTGNETATGSVDTIAIAFSGQVMIQGLSLLRFSPGAPPIG